MAPSPRPAAGGPCGPGGRRTPAPGRTPGPAPRRTSDGLVAAQIQPAEGPAGADGVGAAQPRHAGGGHQGLFRKPLQHAGDQHGLGLRPVEGLADDLVLRQQVRQIFLRHPEGVGPDGAIGGDLSQGVPQGVGLVLSQLARRVLLAVQVAQVHPVEVDQVKMAHPRPGQGDGRVGPQPPQAADRHPSGVESRLELRPVARLQGPAHLFPCGRHLSRPPRSPRSPGRPRPPAPSRHRAAWE